MQLALIGVLILVAGAAKVENRAYGGEYVQTPLHGELILKWLVCGEVQQERCLQEQLGSLLFDVIKIYVSLKAPSSLSKENFALGPENPSFGSALRHLKSATIFKSNQLSTKLFY